MTFLILEDEPLFAADLKLKLESACPGAEILATIDSAGKAIDFLDRTEIQPDGYEIVEAKDIADRLDPAVFIRLNRQWVVNISAVRKIEKSYLATSSITIEPDLRIKLSYGKMLDFIKQLES